MGMNCTVCGHEQRSEIERRLVEGSSMRAVAGQYGVGRASVARHVANGHVPLVLVAGADADREHHGRDLGARVEFLWRKSAAILEAAEGRPTLQLAAIRELRATVELLGKLTGQLYPQPDMAPLSIKLQFSNGEPLEPPAWLRPRARVQLPEPSVDR